jgi:hypothetical protein
VSSAASRAHQLGLTNPFRPEPGPFDEIARAAAIPIRPGKGSDPPDGRDGLDELGWAERARPPTSSRPGLTR